MRSRRLSETKTPSMSLWVLRSSEVCEWRRPIGLRILSAEKRFVASSKSRKCEFAWCWKLEFNDHSSVSGVSTLLASISKMVWELACVFFRMRSLRRIGLDWIDVYSGNNKVSGQSNIDHTPAIRLYPLAISDPGGKRTMNHRG